MNVDASATRGRGLGAVVTAVLGVLIGMPAPAYAAPTVPAITATPASPKPGEDVELRATATDPEGGPLTYAWDLNDDGLFDDGLGATITRPFPSSGDLVARVRATDTDGAATASNLLTIAGEPGPTPAPTPDPAALPDAPPAAGTPAADATAAAALLSGPTAPLVPTGRPARPQRTTAAPARLLRPFPRVRIQGRLTPRGARFTRFTVTAPPGARVEATCDGRGCPRRRIAASTGTSRAVRLSGLLGSYRAGTRLVVRVTRRAAIGKYTAIVVRRGRPPARVDRCLRPGATAPVRCPAN